jgi:large subunit ribosomal protein L3
MGAEKVTVQNLTIHAIDTERNLILVKGSVPGAKGGDVIITPAMKMRNKG